MTIDDERLRRLYQGYAATRGHQSRDRCPSSSEIVGSFEISASARRKKKIIEHIAACAPCREEFMALLERQCQEPRRLESAPRRFGPPYPELWRWAGAFLGLSLIVISLVVVRHQWRLTTVVRDASTVITLRSPKPGRPVSGALVFQWKNLAQAEYFVIELFDEALLPVWTSDRIRESRFEVPADVRSRLTAGRAYFWMVTGFAGAVRIGESSLGRFVIRP